MPPIIKRVGDDSLDASQPVFKLARVDTSGQPHANAADYGGNKKKLAGSSRTGQACDRCKIRKIRCDARPGGCSPCLQNQTECKTTDRITGRATSRGHTENLESENTNLRLYIIELQAQLKENGLEPRSTPSIPSPSQPSVNNTNGTWDDQRRTDGDNAAHFSSAQDGGGGGGGQASMLPEFRPGCVGDNYLGVVSGNSWLSPIEGTSLSLFGTKIDLADFMPQESTPDLAAMSYETFLEYAFGQRPAPPAPQLPDYESCCVFADWYFRSITPFTPILHKPDFMQMLHRVYRENYQMTSAESVMVHMMLALMNFQWSARNKSEQSRKQSFEHYHYSLTHIPRLIASHQLADLQALTLICHQLRNQPRSGAAWWFTDLVVGLAVESGLHRSVKAWQGSELTPHVIEMRKRVFWSLIALHVPVSGKLGRPMPLRMEDFDVEIPEALPDHLPNETLPKWKRCSFRAGVQAMKMIRILMGVYSVIYSVRSTNGPYEVHVRQLEKDLEAFRAQLPAELLGGAQTREEERVYALYLQIGMAEIQLLLHHPSLCRSQSPRTISANLDVCLQASTSLLNTATQLKQLKSLDTTWYTCMTFLAAVFTTLFVFHERKDQMSLDDVQRLKEDMIAWLDVMAEIGQLLGSMQRLQNAVGAIVEQFLSSINAHVMTKTGTAAVAPSESSVSSDRGASEPSFIEHGGFEQPYQNGNDKHGAMADQQEVRIPNNHLNAVALQHPQPLPANNMFVYTDARDAAMAAFAQMNGYNGSHHNADDLKSPISPSQPFSSSESHASLSTSTGFVSNYQSPMTSQGGFQDASHAHLMGMVPVQQVGGPLAWRQFANNVMTNISGHDLAVTTNTFMPVPAVAQNPDMAGLNLNVPMQVPTNPMNIHAQQSWPYVQFSST